MRKQSNRWTAARVALFGVRAIARLLLLAVVAAILAAAAVLLVIPRVTGAEALTVLTGSMTPEIPVGSVVMVRPVDPDSLRVGDVATYQPEPGSAAITHRIVKVDESTSPVSFIFKGDANRGPDVDRVYAQQIRGEVWFDVPYLGTVRDALQGGPGLTLLAALVVGALSVGLLVGGIRDQRRGTNREDDDQPRESVEIVGDRALIMAEIATVAVFGTPPREAAREWGGILLRQTETSFTVLIAPEPWEVSTIVRDLQIFDPMSLEVVEAPKRLSVRLDASSARLWEPLALQEAGHHVA